MRYVNKEMYDGDLMSIIVTDRQLGKFNFILSENMHENDLGWFLGKGYQGVPIVKINSRVKDKSLMLDTIAHELMHLAFDLNGYNDHQQHFSQEKIVDMLSKYAVSVAEVARTIQRIIIDGDIVELIDVEIDEKGNV